jgi:D-alanine-D-alanine ligase
MSGIFMSGKHVAVLMGGFSSERPVSLSSGAACADALETEGYRVTRIDVDRNVASVLADLRPDVAFNALHGPFGEDGTIQGILEYLEIPYTHSGVLASALAMDKAQAKHVASAAGIPVAEARIMDRHDFGTKHPMKPPYVVKPVREGSSFGVVIVKEDQSHPPQVITSSEWRYGDRVMVERYVYGRELTCGVMGDTALGVTEIIPQGHAFYDYDSKYVKGGSKHVIPADILPNIYQKIQTLAVKAHQAIGCRGVSRSDFRFDDRFSEDGELIWLEVNTQPGMTPTSLVPEMAAHAGHTFGEFLRWIVEDASCLR